MYVEPREQIYFNMNVLYFLSESSIEMIIVNCHDSDRKRCEMISCDKFEFHEMNSNVVLQWLRTFRVVIPL